MRIRSRFCPALLACLALVSCSKSQVVKTAGEVAKDALVYEGKALLKREVSDRLAPHAAALAQELGVVSDSVPVKALMRLAQLAPELEDLPELPDFDVLEEARKAGLTLEVPELPEGRPLPSPRDVPLPSPSDLPLPEPGEDAPLPSPEDVPLPSPEDVTPPDVPDDAALRRHVEAVTSTVQAELLVYANAALHEKSRTLLAGCSDFDVNQTYTNQELAERFRSCASQLPGVAPYARLAQKLESALERVRNHRATLESSLTRALQDSKLGQVASAALELQRALVPFLSQVQRQMEPEPEPAQPMRAGIGLGARYAFSYWSPYSDIATGENGGPDAAVEGQIYTAANIQKRLDLTLSKADHWAVNAVLADSGNELSPKLRQVIGGIGFDFLGLTVEYSRYHSVAGGRLDVDNEQPVMIYDENPNATLWSGRGYYITDHGNLLGAFYIREEIPTLYLTQNPIMLHADASMLYQSFGFYLSIDWFMSALVWGPERVGTPLFGFSSRNDRETRSYVVMGGFYSEGFYGIVMPRSSNTEAGVSYETDLESPGIYLNTRFGYGIGFVPKQSGFGLMIGYDGLLYSSQFMRSKPKLDTVDAELNTTTSEGGPIPPYGYIHGPVVRGMYRF